MDFFSSIVYILEASIGTVSTIEISEGNLGSAVAQVIHEGGFGSFLSSSQMAGFSIASTVTKTIIPCPEWYFSGVGYADTRIDRIAGDPGEHTSFISVVEAVLVNIWSK